MPTTLLTGGCGYIGSHTAVALLQAGHHVILVDSFCNSHPDVATKIAQTVVLDDPRRLVVVEADLTVANVLDNVFCEYAVDAVIHFAAHKSVGESVADPLKYHHNNLVSLINLLQTMDKHHVHRLIFSSSATVYAPCDAPITEDKPTRPLNPYGWTKWMGEQILRDVAWADGQVIALRYFNPAGAYGLLSENPVGPANNLFPVIMEVLRGKRPHLTVFGSDWPTRDGTGERDYVHVMDLAEAHVAALQHQARFAIFNVGTGRGSTVLEVHRAMERLSGRDIPLVMEARRPGDAASVVVDPARARKELGWSAHRTLDDMVESALS